MFSSRTALHQASQKGQADVVELLLTNGAEIEAVDDKQATSLILASELGQTSVVKILLANGAQVDKRQDGYV